MRLLASLRHWTGRSLVDPTFSESAQSRELYHASFAVLSHNSEADPLLNYANKAALTLFEFVGCGDQREPHRLWRAFARCGSPTHRILQNLQFHLQRTRGGEGGHPSMDSGQAPVRPYINLLAARVHGRDDMENRNGDGRRAVQCRQGRSEPVPAAALARERSLYMRMAISARADSASCST